MNIYTEERDGKHFGHYWIGPAGYISASHDTAEEALADARREAAKHLFLVYTGEKGTINSLYGRPKAGCRAHILSALVGKKVPHSKAGWTVFREAMLKLYGVEGTCDADCNDNLRKVATCT